MVAKEGSLEQLKACGLYTVADQMRLRKLVYKHTENATSTPFKTKNSSTFKWPGRKLTKKELKEIPLPEDRRVYIMK